MPNVRSLIVLLVILAIALWMGMLAVDQSLRGSGPRVDITDEEFTPTAGTTVTLQNSNLQDTKYALQVDVTVTDTQGAVFPQPGNYTWNENNGTIFINATGELANENKALIDYHFNTAVDEATSIGDTAQVVLENGRWLLLVVAAALLIAMLAKLKTTT